MSDTWYKTKEWKEYINNVTHYLDEHPENEQLQTLASNLRYAAEEYHEKSIIFSKRDISLEELNEIKETFLNLKQELDQLMDQNTAEE